MQDLYTSGPFPLRPVPPFDFAKSLAFLGVFPLLAGEQTTVGPFLTKGACFQGRPYIFHVLSGGSIEDPGLECYLYGAQPITPEAQAALLDRVAFFLSLDDSLRPFYDLASGDARFWPVVERLYGYHQVKFPTPYENAVWSVLSQRVPRGEARKMKAALTAQYGCRLALEGVDYSGFPEPEQILAADERELLEIVGMENKVAYLKAVSNAFAGVDPAFLRTAPYQAVKDWLLGIRGIGKWSAAFILIRGLGRMDAITTEERNLLEAAATVYGGHPDWDEVKRLAEPYGEYQGYWAHYLRASVSLSSFCF